MKADPLPRWSKHPWRLAASLLALAVGTFYLFNSGPDYSAVRSSKEVWNLGHIGYFALLIFLLARIPPLQRQPLWRQWLGLLLFSLLLGAGIELLQYGTTRSPDLGDISRDMAGALLALAFHPRLSRFKTCSYRSIARALALLVLFIHLLPLTFALLDEMIARQQFPVLGDFSTPFELWRWDGGADRRVVDLEAGRALEVGLKTTRYSGAGLAYFPADWRGYQTLNLVFYNPDDKPLRITLRVHDRRHEQGPRAYATNDRFNRAYLLAKGWNKISVSLKQIEHAPRGRLMDLSQISDVSFFTTRLRQPRVIYLEKIYLL